MIKEAILHGVTSLTAFPRTPECLGDLLVIVRGRRGVAVLVNSLGRLGKGVLLICPSFSNHLVAFLKAKPSHQVTSHQSCGICSDL